MIIDCISDLHGYYPPLDGGDLLIVAGDLTQRDTHLEYLEVCRWLGKQDYKLKVIVGGNHDNNLGDAFACGDLSPGIEYLQDSGTEFEGLKIWGSPWVKYFIGMNPHCAAFTCQTEAELCAIWGMIPNDTDILVTHSPPFRVLDENRYGVECGSPTLRWRLDEIKPKLHVFGHIHECGGQKFYYKNHKQVGYRTICVNASLVDEYYREANKPMRVIL